MLEDVTVHDGRKRSSQERSDKVDNWGITSRPSQMGLVNVSLNFDFRKGIPFLIVVIVAIVAMLVSYENAEQVYDRIVQHPIKAAAILLSFVIVGIFSFLRRRKERVVPAPKAETAVSAKPVGRYLWKQGNFSDIYRDSDRIIKVAINPELNGVLEQEAEFLFEAGANKTDSYSLGRISEWVPRVLRTSVNTEGCRVNEYSFHEGYVSVTDILTAFPSGLDPRDAAWIARRIFGAACAAEAFGYVHGSILPDHILVHKTSHDPLYLGWGTALKNPKKTGRRIRIVVSSFRDMYPPEVLQKDVPTEKTDVYMAAALVTRLFATGDDKAVKSSELPRGVSAVLNSCMNPNPDYRPTPRQAMDQFTEAVRVAWGKQYRELVVPDVVPNRSVHI